MAPALLVDGGQTTSKVIGESVDIKKAVSESVPIVISQPTKGEIEAITGMGIDRCEAAVVVPKNGGEEFVINVIRARGYKEGVRALGNDQDDLDAQVHAVAAIIDRENIGRSIGKKKGSVSSHKRWTLIDYEPFFWGEQGQSIHVGFQYDLYNVVDPAGRKYLTVQTVGTGVSPGVLSNDSWSHRGFFQTRVSVSVGDMSYTDWKKQPLILEKSAPESDNNSNSATVTTGATFTAAGCPGITFTGMPMVSSFIGFGLSYSSGKTSTFHDFTVNQDPVDPMSPSSRKWTYWLSGANGSKIRKKHQAYDLVGYFGIKELPQLAKDSVLMPHMECVYYADGEETGKVTIRTSVGQRLVDIQKCIIGYRVNELPMNMNHLTATIDFSQVHS